MGDTLTVTFSNMAMEDQAIVNPPNLLDQLRGKIMVFRLNTVQQTNLKLATNLYCTVESK